MSQKRRIRRHVIEMPNGASSDDGEVIEFNFKTEDGSLFQFSAASDAVDQIMYNLEQLAISALKRRMERGTDRGVAPRELPALRTISDGFAVEVAEPGDNWEGYRLMIYRMSRPPIMVLLQRPAFEKFVEALRNASLDAQTAKKH